MNPELFTAPIEILLVEDNPGDIGLVREALTHIKIINHLNIVKNGLEALAFLRREGAYTQAQRPDMILLDLNIPKKSGHEVLAEIKQDPNLRRIPVAILTSSQAQQDVMKAYDLHANCYIAKPLDFDRYIEIARSIEDFWFSVASLPPD